MFEKFALVMNLVIAISGLIYARWLNQYVNAAGNGTAAMQEIARAVREGAYAYLRRQFTVVSALIFVIAGVLVATKWPWNDPNNNTEIQIAIGRGVAFLMGSLFSAMVGLFGMRMATIGNLKVAAAARESFGRALQIGYRSGTVTGMLTDGLGLLGGTLIFLYYGEKAFEVLLGFGFGGTLLALFMRVGGGIYTKAADVGADLVGKIEAGIPEDDPRNAATIADNVGDNVGDCAGMAADIFESYEVTIVAALILGMASFGHMGVVFPLLVHAIGVIGSIISTSQVKAESQEGVKSAMGAVTKGFWMGALISVVAICALGAIYLRPSPEYIVGESIKRGLYKEKAFIDKLNQVAGTKIETVVPKDEKPREAYIASINSEWKKARDKQAAIADEPVVAMAQKYMPLKVGFDWRPIVTCLIGIALALALHWCTDYWTSTEHDPVKQLAKACRTGHATNIIQGLALGYESAVWAVLIISAAILGSVLVYSGTNPIFIAYGVAMCGIGMLTLTGNIISMDVFGPIADNANGIGEMGYNRDENNQPLPPSHPDYMDEASYKKSRQILADLDAVGNTTKAITKGIAIGSAVLAAVSLFASFIAVVATGKGEDAITNLSIEEFMVGAAKLNLADPYVFIGMMIGGAVPFLFSSMTIRAVGRAAFLIVQECRAQFRDKEIWAGTKKPNYGRVVDICTSTAQRELIGPGLLAIFAPVIVGFAMGPYALGGYLAGMIVVGQLIAVFMANSGGAWDNAKKTIEDQPKTATTGKGSESHMASITGDTVGDPLKDTAGPALNPLIKVMNMVSLLILPLVMAFNLKDGTNLDQRFTIGLSVLGVGLVAVGWAWWQSKTESAEMKAIDEEFSRANQ
ncbi:MAG: sodium/proton-translocating pyrophosphatase [Gemmataceae bacterium]|nr:sodium/proton-translocating pyrophosphatase [Gemmataceae bacterium]